MTWLCILLCAMPLAAAELYLMPSEFFVSPGQAVSVEIQGAAAPEGLRDATLFTASAVYNITNLRAEGGAVSGRAVIKGNGVEILAVRSASGREFAKAMVVSEVPDDTWKKRTGHALEIVPLRNPYEVKAGEDLPVEVLFRGQPAQSARVLWHRGPATASGVTDGSGRATIKIAELGKWRVDALFTAQGESFWASLSMEMR